MAKFTIHTAQGGDRAVGCPTFTGQYMKPGVLDFREIASPNPINFEIGDYVDYTRTGLRYYLFDIPQAKRQAYTNKYGASILYQNVQFRDASYYLVICPFRDMVVGDNRVHFSTQPSISVFDDVAGIAERLQACLDNMYPNEWVVRLATSTDGASADLLALMAEEREFTVSGVSISGALDKVYEVWPEVGWIYSYGQVTIDGQSVLRHIVTIGGAGLNIVDTYAYGKGNGLLGITKTSTNKDELANRLYVYGSNRNMKPRWYNDKYIKDADSVDIQHLMLPIDPIGQQGDPDYYPGWGRSVVSGGGLMPDPAKAYIETNPAPSLIRPKTVYFDGTGDYKEIYPTIENTTIQELLDTMASGTKYRPDTSKYSDTSVRVDRVLSAQETFDNGLAGVNGKDTAYTSDPYSVSASGSESVDPGNKHVTYTIFNQSVTFTSAQAGKVNLDFSFAIDGTASCSGIEGGKIIAHLRKGTADVAVKEVALEASANAGQFLIQSFVFSLQKQIISAETYSVVLELDINIDLQDTATVAYSVSGTMTLSLSRYREKTFKMSIRQIGFNIEEQAALGEGKTIAMRSGQCVGRTFKISSCTYDSTNDKWDLEVIRSNDDSLSQWFPNSSYPILGASNSYAGDQFVLLDIAMPDIYITVAENRLLDAAQELLADVSIQQWQYTPDIDAKFMAETGRSIKAGDYLIISDEEKILLNNGGVAKRTLVDSVVINEGEAAIPTYKVTMRDKKKKSYSDTASVPGVSSTPVTTVKESSNVAREVVVSGDSFFEEYTETVEEGDQQVTRKSVKLKDDYIGFWANGFIAAGGVGSSSGSGGGGLVESIYRFTNLGGTFSDSANDTFDAYTINSIHLRVKYLEEHPVTGISEVRKGTAVSGGDVTTASGVVTIQFPTIPTADNNTIGGFETGYTESGKNYAVQMSGNKAYVNVPWSNTTYKLTLNGNTNGDSAGTSLGTLYAPTAAGTQGYCLIANASGVPTWTDLSGLYLPLTGGELTGDLWLHTGSSNYGSKLWFGDKGSGDGYAYIHEDSDDHLKIYAANGLQFATGSSYYIQIDNEVVIGASSRQSAYKLYVYGAGYYNGALTVNSNLYTSASITVGSGTSTEAARKICFGSSSYYLSLNTSNEFHFSHGVYSDGFVVAGGVASSSDARLKSDLEPIGPDKAISVLMSLRPKEWVWNDNSNLAGKRSAGLVAQEVEKVIPFSVVGGDYLALNYNVLHAYEIAGMQDHERRIAELERENKELKRRLGYATR